MGLVKLQSTDGDIREVDDSELQLSATLKNLIEDAGVNTEIPVPNVDTKTLDFILEYLKYHTEHPEEHSNFISNGVKDEDIGTWDLPWAENMNNIVLAYVTLAANFLDIESLLHLTCKVIARKIKGKNPDEIKKALKI